MRTLAIETATEACSVALFEGQSVVANDHVVIGRGHAEMLVPMIAAFPQGGRVDRILVGCGPGSFTGLRVGIAAAKGLAFAWGVPVYGFPTLSLIAAQAFQAGIGTRNETLVVANEGGHGEVFIQRFTFGNPSGLAPFVSLPFGKVSEFLKKNEQVVGTASGRMADVTAVTHGIVPDARSVILLPSTLLNLFAQPIYGRGADAKPVQSL